MYISGLHFIPGMESTFQEYQGFSEKAVTEESLPAYTRAKTKLEAYLPYENELVSWIPYCSAHELYAKYAKLVLNVVSLYHRHFNKSSVTFCDSFLKSLPACYCIVQKGVWV